MNYEKSIDSGPSKASPREQTSGFHENSIQQSVQITDRSLFAFQEDSVFVKNPKQANTIDRERVISNLMNQRASLDHEHRYNPQMTQMAPGHNILLQQLSQYASPRSHREEMESYRPSVMTQNVIKTLLDHKIKNKRDVIQRICAGKAERERLTRRHPKSQAMARRPNRQIKPFESAQHDALR